MNKILLTFCLIIFGGHLAFSQENERFANTQLLNIKKLADKGKFVKGFIYLGNDTIEMNLLTYSGKRKANYFLFCIAGTTTDSLQVFRPNQINGYQIDNITYISLITTKGSFFLRQFKTGKINLYEKYPLPDDNRYLYYLKFADSENYFILDPQQKNITEYELPDSRQSASSGKTLIFLQSNGISEKFKVFISTYLGDCGKVINMVNADFYTIADIPNIIELYNNCY